MSTAEAEQNKVSVIETQEEEQQDTDLVQIHPDLPMVPEEISQSYALLNADARDLLVRLQSKIEAGVKAMLNQRYAIGELLVKAEEDPEKYGDNVVSSFEIILGIPSGTLHRSLRVVQTFNKKEFADITSRRTASGNVLTFEHLYFLTRAIEADRPRLIRTALEEDWSSRELASEISVTTGSQSVTRLNAGRPLKTPTSPLAGMQSARKAVTKVLRGADTWVEFGFKAMQNTPPDKVKEKTVEVAQETYDAIVDAEYRIKEMKSEARKTLRRCQKAYASNIKNTAQEE